jgi:hypothetical protein
LEQRFRAAQPLLTEDDRLGHANRVGNQAIYPLSDLLGSAVSLNERHRRRRQARRGRRRVFRRVCEAGEPKENRVDRRLRRNQSGKRKVVVMIRERGGKTLPGVFRNEGDALTFIR